MKWARSGGCDADGNADNGSWGGGGGRNRCCCDDDAAADADDDDDDDYVVVDDDDDDDDDDFEDDYDGGCHGKNCSVRLNFPQCLRRREFAGCSCS